MPFSDRTAVVAVGGNSLIVDREHESILDRRPPATTRTTSPTWSPPAGTW